MDLESITIMGTLLGGGSVLVVSTLAYSTYKLNRSMEKVRESTTKFLDAATIYLESRAETEKEIKAFRKLARTRERYNI